MTSEHPGPLRRLASAVRRHLGRALTGNLQAVRVSDHEKARLESVGVLDETLQRYAAWRRSTLFAVAMPTLLSAALATIDTLSQGTVGLSLFGKFLTLVSTLILYALPVSAVAAALYWYRLKRSHRWLVWGWALAFLPPFLLALCPIGWWFTPSPVPAERSAQKFEWAVLDALNGVYFYCTLMPAVLSLLPGMIRACLRLKTLLPASIVPGWFLVAGAPFFLLVWLVVLIALNHLAGNPLLVTGALLWIGAPMIFVLRSDLFIRPIAVAECRQVDRLRRLSWVVTLLAVVLLTAFVLTKQVFGLYLVGFDEDTTVVGLLQSHFDDPEGLPDLLQHADALLWIGELNVYQLATEYFSRSLFVTVVFSDLLLRINLSVWKYEQEFHRTAAAGEYDTTMAAMDRHFTRKGVAAAGQDYPEQLTPLA